MVTGEWALGSDGFLLFFFWLLIIAGVFYLIKALTKGTKKDGTDETALDILNKRYARGEITREEFEKMKGDISGK